MGHLKFTRPIRQLLSSVILRLIGFERQIVNLNTKTNPRKTLPNYYCRFKHYLFSKGKTLPHYQDVFLQFRKPDLCIFRASKNPFTNRVSTNRGCTVNYRTHYVFLRLTLIFFLERFLYLKHCTELCTDAGNKL